MNDPERVSFEDLDEEYQTEIRRLMHHFTLIAGTDKPLPDDQIQPIVRHLHRIFHRELTETFGLPADDLLNGVIGPVHRISVSWHCTLLIMITVSLRGQSVTRQILTQALADLDDLGKLGQLFLHATCQTLRADHERTDL